MADLRELEDHLKTIGCNFRVWGRAELKELANVLLPNETVETCVNGQYEGGFALLVATDQRVLLIDKKPMYLTLEDIRFDMISEIDFNHRMMNASVFICTPNKSLRFTAYNQGRLRKLFHLVQTKVMEIRQHYQHQGQMWKDYANSLGQQDGGGAIQSQQPMFESYLEQADMSMTPAQTKNSQTPEITTGQPRGVAAPQTMIVPPMPFRTVAPLISAYTRLPMMSRQRRFLGSRAVNVNNPTAQL